MNHAGAGDPDPSHQPAYKSTGTTHCYKAGSIESLSELQQEMCSSVDQSGLWASLTFSINRFVDLQISWNESVIEFQWPLLEICSCGCGCEQGLLRWWVQWPPLAGVI